MNPDGAAVSQAFNQSVDTKVDINRPTYYTRGKIETWDFIIDKKLDFLEGNIVKYVVRWRQKNGVEDLKKARVYLNKLIEEADA